MKARFKKPKIIFIDLDGTTLDIKNKRSSDVSQTNINAIKQCQKNKIKVIPCTGRGNNPRTHELLEKLGCSKDYILWNGAQIFINGQNVLSTAIKSSIVQKIFEKARKMKVSMIFNSDFKFMSYTSSILMKLGIKYKKGKANRYKDFKNDFEAFKIIFWHRSKKKVEKFAYEIESSYGKYLSIAFAGSKNKFIEVTANSVSKGSANEYVANLLNVDLKDCWHFGDSMNDYSTTKVMNNVVAMANSNDEFLKSAPIHSQFDYTNAGLAKTFNYLFFENVAKVKKTKKDEF